MTTYVALGDSISIDYYAGGPGRGAASLLVRNRDEDFPDWAGRDLTTRFPELRSELLVTDGATSQTSSTGSCRSWRGWPSRRRSSR
jgi:hypothetical protein